MQSTIALEIYNSVKNTFCIPQGWDSSEWRDDVMLASGLTALAVEAALLDVVTKPCTVLRSSRLLSEHIGESKAGILGYSYSGQATEVVDGLIFAQTRGIPIALASNNKALNPSILLPDLHLPRSLQHILFTIAVPRLLEKDPAFMAIDFKEDLILFIEEMYRTNTIPIFVGNDKSFQCKALLAYWVEYLHRPGFNVYFPDWTHDLIWAMTWQPKMGFAFLFEEPDIPLSDNRFAHMLAWANDKQYPYLVLPSSVSISSYVGFVLMCVAMYYELALRLKVDITTELQFNSWKDHINVR